MPSTPMEQPPFSFLRSLHWFCLDSLIIGICSYPSKSWWNSGPYLQLQHTSLSVPPYPNPVLPLNELPISNYGLPILRCLCPVCRFLLLSMQHSPTQPLAGLRSPGCLSRRRCTAQGKSRPRCTSWKPTEILSPKFLRLWNEFFSRKLSRRRRPVSWMLLKVTASRIQILLNLVSPIFPLSM